MVHGQYRLIMKLNNILEMNVGGVRPADDHEEPDYKRNSDLSDKFIECIKTYTNGQVDLKGADAASASEGILFREPGGGLGYWIAAGVMHDAGYSLFRDHKDTDAGFIKALKAIGMTRGEAVHILHQRDL
jgi:hypothetical protein